ncbi:MAG TPA: hypothetical protein VK603_16770, partial [Candidatus Saccharimonadales bacterium]|nr:hypothetical protein [Candidatus Saccharimonadales bacterium]
GERTKTLINDFHSQSPNFAPFASLREILRVSVAAQPHWDLRGEKAPFTFGCGFAALGLRD